MVPSPELSVKLATLHQIHEEDKGPAQVCAILDNGCFSSEPFNILMHTIIDSAGILYPVESYSYIYQYYTAPGDDYVPVQNAIMRFTPQDENACLLVTIIDEDIVEQNESFFVTLERTADLNERITIDPDNSEGEVVIGNDDGKFLFSNLRCILMTIYISYRGNIML